MQSLVQSKLDEVLQQFSLDADGSSMCRLKGMLKDQPLRLKNAIDELQEAKGNREASIGIFVFARAMVVATARKEAAGEVDFSKIQDQVDALAAWSERVADMATKARTIQNNGKVIEQSATELKTALDQRVAAVLAVLAVLCRCGSG